MDKTKGARCEACELEAARLAYAADLGASEWAAFIDRVPPCDKCGKGASHDPEYIARAVREWTWSGVSRVDPIEGLDPGIAPWVELLRAWRIETFESCQGGADPARPERGHAYAEPTIAFGGGPEAGFRAYAIAVTHALPIQCIRRVWKHSDHELTGPCWEMVFTRQATAAEYDEVMHTLAFERGDV